MSTKEASDDFKLIYTQLYDVSTLHSVVFNSASYLRSKAIVKAALARDGIDALTKHLPRLGKAFDRTLAGGDPLNPLDLGFETQVGEKVPLFMRELFLEVLYADGTLRPDACATTVGHIRQILYCFYKYDLPYNDEQRQLVLNQFERTEGELPSATHWEHITNRVAAHTNSRRRLRRPTYAKAQAPERRPQEEVIREARILLQNLFAYFDPKDIIPRNGPGAVAERRTPPWNKFSWDSVPERITNHYPYLEYFVSSGGHVCDCYKEFDLLLQKDLPARVILVPKDSRGPRLISAEPKASQWIQQGLFSRIVELVESHPLTKGNVRFTDQRPNGWGALVGSKHPERYVTLDLAEASDRVSLDLVRLLFPDWLMPYLEAARTPSTSLPDGRIISLRKFAPMGSALCFPILALTIFAILYGAAPDLDTVECIYVYGDDVIVPTAFAGDAIEQLESFGLKINRDKSCIRGFFRESCGVDAFKGQRVTPVRYKTVWSYRRSPKVFTSWIDYSNSMWKRQYYSTYLFMVRRLFQVYGTIPEKGQCLSCPALEYVPLHHRPRRTRVNTDLQKVEYLVWDVESPVTVKRLPGWQMLLRWFTEANRAITEDLHTALDEERNRDFSRWRLPWNMEGETPFKVRHYTQRRKSKLVRCWR